MNGWAQHSRRTPPAAHRHASRNRGNPEPHGGAINLAITQEARRAAKQTARRAFFIFRAPQDIALATANTQNMAPSAHSPPRCLRWRAAPSPPPPARADVRSARPPKHLHKPLRQGPMREARGPQCHRTHVPRAGAMARSAEPPGPSHPHTPPRARKRRKAPEGFLSAFPAAARLCRAARTTREGTFRGLPVGV